MCYSSTSHVSWTQIHLSPYRDHHLNTKSQPVPHQPSPGSDYKRCGHIHQRADNHHVAKKKNEDLSLVEPAHMQENNFYPRIEDNRPKFDAALNSHCTFSGQSRDAFIGICACDIPANSIPAPDTPTLYRALRAAISSKVIQVIENIHIKNQRLCYHLQAMPILEGSSLIYVVLEAHDITHWTWTNHLQESSGAHEWYHWYRPIPEGKGSVLWLTVKMDRSQIASTVKKSYASTSDDSENLMGKVRAFTPRQHILLVEDSLANHMVMLKLLHSLGFECIGAAWDGAKVVQMVKQTPLSYNMILMDISMPVLDGLEATSQIRSMDVDVPIVALTANALKGDAEMYFAAGMDDYIGKLDHRNQLLGVIWKLRARE
ncbi:unnamed protein product [Penicillium nalgiovense]|nr:unnamed protein product [Penicillium nalgiovense]